MDGNKPKQRVEVPVDKQSNLTLKSRDEAPKVDEIKQEELGEEFKLPDYRPQSLFTRKQVSREKKKKLQKIAYKSKRFNRIRSKK